VFQSLHSDQFEPLKRFSYLPNNLNFKIFAETQWTDSASFAYEVFAAAAEIRACRRLSPLNSSVSLNEAAASCALMPALFSSHQRLPQEALLSSTRSVVHILAHLKVARFLQWLHKLWINPLFMIVITSNNMQSVFVYYVIVLVGGQSDWYGAFKRGLYICVRIS
jgi:hypothetical protein